MFKYCRYNANSLLPCAKERLGLIQQTLKGKRRTSCHEHVESNYALGRPGVKGHGPSRIQNANAADPGGMNPVAMVGQQLDGWMFRNQGNGGLCESLFPCVRTDY